MTKRQAELLAQLRHAREFLKTQDHKNVALVKAVYDAMLHRFGDPEVMENLSDADYVDEWNKCRVSVMKNLDINYLMSEDTFTSIWNAYDVITTEQAQAYA